MDKDSVISGGIKLAPQSLSLMMPHSISSISGTIIAKVRTAPPEKLTLLFKRQLPAAYSEAAVEGE